jgi:hypothetical protein
MRQTRSGDSCFRIAHAMFVKGPRNAVPIPSSTLAVYAKVLMCNNLNAGTRRNDHSGAPGVIPALAALARDANAWRGQ